MNGETSDNYYYHDVGDHGFDSWFLNGSGSWNDFFDESEHDSYGSKYETNANTCVSKRCDDDAGNKRMSFLVSL